jgi:predicted HTH domain antitoxin
MALEARQLATVHTKTTRTLTITLSLPATVQVTEQQAREVLVLKLVDEGVLSQSDAAEALGISRAEVIELMGQHSIPVMRYGPGDFEQESKALHELQALRRGRTH